MYIQVQGDISHAPSTYFPASCLVACLLPHCCHRGVECKPRAARSRCTPRHGTASTCELAFRPASHQSQLHELQPHSHWLLGHYQVHELQRALCPHLSWWAAHGRSQPDHYRERHVQFHGWFFRVTPSGDSLDIFEGQRNATFSETYITPDLYWETNQGIDLTRYVLNNYPINVSIWSFCTQLDYNDAA
jgi:hypothetical protein